MTDIALARERENLKTSLSAYRVAVASAAVLLIAAGYYRDYHFLPASGSDGFASQLNFIRDLIDTGQLGRLWEDPLYATHFLRWVVTYPFIYADQAFWPASSLFLMAGLLVPLLLAFSNRRNDWRGLFLLWLRLPIMLMPLAVSGRTALVAIGMGYIVFGVLRRPFSITALIVGSAFSVLSSVAVLLTIAVLVFVGNRHRSRRLVVTKALLVACLAITFAPSVAAKAYGFTTGAPGYQSLEEVEQGRTMKSVTALDRILSRSTLYESYVNKNWPRLALYLLFVAGLAMHFILVGLRREHHLLSGVFLCLSAGLCFEGLGVWPLLFPLMWRFTSLSNDPATYAVSALRKSEQRMNT